MWGPVWIVRRHSDQGVWLFDSRSEARRFAADLESDSPGVGVTTIRGGSVYTSAAFAFEELKDEDGA